MLLSWLSQSLDGFEIPMYSKVLLIVAGIWKVLESTSTSCFIAIHVVFKIKDEEEGPDLELLIEGGAEDSDFTDVETNKDEENKRTVQER